MTVGGISSKRTHPGDTLGGHTLSINPTRVVGGHTKTLGQEKSWPRVLLGVTDGTRTRDTQDHNLVLYQLNYSHHYRIQ